MKQKGEQKEKGGKRPKGGGEKINMTLGENFKIKQEITVRPATWLYFSWKKWRSNHSTKESSSTFVQPKQEKALFSLHPQVPVKQSEELWKLYTAKENETHWWRRQRRWRWRVTDTETKNNTDQINIKGNISWQKASICSLSLKAELLNSWVSLRAVCERIHQVSCIMS